MDLSELNCVCVMPLGSITVHTAPATHQALNYSLKETTMLLGTLFSNSKKERKKNHHTPLSCLTFCHLRSCSMSLLARLASIIIVICVTFDLRNQTNSRFYSFHTQELFFVTIMLTHKNSDPFLLKRKLWGIQNR